MFFRKVVTKRNGKKYTYLKLIESYREEGKIKQRVIANLGNIDSFDAEKINSLITSLHRLSEQDTHEEAEQPSLLTEQPNIQKHELESVWNSLGLTEILNRSLPEDAPNKTTGMIKAMVFQKLVNPVEHRSIAASYRCLDLPELKDENITGIDFYRAVTCFAKTKPELENHLYNTLLSYKDDTHVVYITFTGTKFTGNECGISNSGTTYQVRPLRKNFYTLTSYLMPGIPFSSTIYSKIPNADELENKLRKDINDYDKCLVIKNDEIDLSSIPRDVFYIKSLCSKNFSLIPISSKELWDERDAFITTDNLWIKDILKRKKRYIICHDLNPGSESDKLVEENLKLAETEIGKIKSQFKKGKIARNKTISNKIEKILSHYKCKDCFNYHIEPGRQELHYYRSEEVIKKLKTIRRTRVVETNIQHRPAMELVNAFLEQENFKKYMSHISDITKVPVVQPFSEFHHIEDYIYGNMLVYMLSYLLKNTLLTRTGLEV